jgi:hypothetical protein
MDAAAIVADIATATCSVRRLLPLSSIGQRGRSAIHLWRIAPGWRAFAAKPRIGSGAIHGEKVFHQSPVACPPDAGSGSAKSLRLRTATNRQRSPLSYDSPWGRPAPPLW